MEFERQKGRKKFFKKWISFMRKSFLCVPSLQILLSSSANTQLCSLLCVEIRERKIVVDMNLIKFNIEFGTAVNGASHILNMSFW